MLPEPSKDFQTVSVHTSTAGLILFVKILKSYLVRLSLLRGRTLNVWESWIGLGAAIIPN